MQSKIIIALICLLPLNSYSFSRKRPVEPVLEKKTQPNTEIEKKSLNNQILHSSMEKVFQKQKGFSKTAVRNAFKFLDDYGGDISKADSICLKNDNKRNRKKIRNQDCLVVADYSKTKTKPRLLWIDPKTGESELFFTAHGKGSHNPDEIEKGILAKRFSNKSGSNMTSLGFYLTDFLYTSKKSTFGPGPRNGLKLDGLNCSNNNARMRYIVMHTADYVPALDKGPNDIGNSEGCVTFPESRNDILKKCTQGALVYAFYEK